MVRQAIEAEPMPSLRRSKLSAAPGRRLEQAALMLSVERTRESAILYLEALFAVTWRQIGGDVALGPTFAKAVGEIGDDVLEALPQHTRDALGELANLAMSGGVPLGSGSAQHVVDARTLAYTLVSQHVAPKLARLAGREAPEPKPEPGPKAVYRRLAQQHHPDKGGSPEVMSALNELYAAIER